MLNWLTHRKERDELDRWRNQWEEARRWLAEFPVVVRVLEVSNPTIHSDSPHPIGDLRDALRIEAGLAPAASQPAEVAKPTEQKPLVPYVVFDTIRETWVTSFDLFLHEYDAHADFGKALQMTQERATKFVKAFGGVGFRIDKVVAQPEKTDAEPRYMVKSSQNMWLADVSVGNGIRSTHWSTDKARVMLLSGALLKTFGEHWGWEKYQIIDTLADKAAPTVQPVMMKVEKAGRIIERTVIGHNGGDPEPETYPGELLFWRPGNIPLIRDFRD